jgi:hypothetical protein
MQLVGRQGTRLELGLVGYQHPDDRYDPWDSNTLLVSVRVLTPEGSWDVVDPCLTTWEAGHLIQWLTALATRPDLLGGRLNEPNVAFTARSRGTPDQLTVAASFELELRPPWLGSGNLTVELDVDRAQLAAAAAALREDLAAFPQRGDDPTL